MPERKLSDWICTDDRINSLSSFEEAFFYRLLTKADGKGRIDARPQVLKASLYPLKRVTLRDVEEAARKLVHVGLASLYETEGCEVLCVEDWGCYQRIRGTEVSRFKDPERGAAQRGMTPRDAAGCGDAPPSSPPLSPSSPPFPPTPPYNPSSSPFPPFSSPCLSPVAGAQEETITRPLRQAGQSRRRDGQGGGRAPQRRRRPGVQGAHGIQDIHGLQDKEVQDMLQRLPDTLRGKTQQWLRYKAERGEPYGKTGLDSLIETILLAVRKHGESAVLKVMGDCMACGYKGITFDRMGRTRRRVVDTNTPSSSNLQEFSRWLFLQQYGGADAGAGTDTDADAGAAQGLHRGGLPM